MSQRQVRIQEVTPLEDFRVRLEFTDGSSNQIDLDPYLLGPVFEPLRTDQDQFRQVRVDAELGTIVWPNGANINPDVLYGVAPPAAWDEERSSMSSAG